MAYLEINERKLYYEVYGKGEPLLFIHDWNTSSVLFKKVNLSYFRKRYQVILIDLPGFGKSDSINELDFEILTGTIDALLIHLKIDKVILMGFCLGAIVALDFTIRFQHKVKNLVLMELLIDFPTILSFLFWPVVGNFALFLFSKTKMGLYLFNVLMWGENKFFRKILNKVVRKTSQKSSYNYLYLLYQYSKLDHCKRSESIFIPVVCINGENTLKVIKKSTGKVYRHLPNGGLCLMEGCKHFLLLENPAKMYEMVDSFINQNRRTYPEKYSC